MKMTLNITKNFQMMIAALVVAVPMIQKAYPSTKRVIEI